MLRLKNIVKTEAGIQADCCPEDSTKPGFVSISLEAEVILKSRVTEHARQLQGCRRRSANRLRKLAENDVIPQEDMFMCH